MDSLGEEEGAMNAEKPQNGKKAKNETPKTNLCREFKICNLKHPTNRGELSFYQSIVCAHFRASLLVQSVSTLKL